MNFIEETVLLWRSNKSEFDKRIFQWADRIERSKPIIKKAKNTFRRWSPLRFYTSITKTRDISTVVFSIRFFGHEVGVLHVKENKIELVIDNGTAEKNKNYFNLQLEKREDNAYDWKHDRNAILFRKHFKELISSDRKIKLRSPEHQVESVFLSEMEKRSKKKFGGAFSGIQPVTIEGFPFQMPLPISASRGKPVKKDGRIDILARRRCKDGKVRLSVWELKKPKTFAKALDQVCIYTAALIQLLRSESGPKWYKIFGFKSRLPKKLEIEAVVAVTFDQKNKLYSKIKNFDKRILQLGNDTIRLSAAYYDENTLFIKSFEENLLEITGC